MKRLIAAIRRLHRRSVLRRKLYGLADRMNDPRMSRDERRDLSAQFCEAYAELDTL